MKIQHHIGVNDDDSNSSLTHDLSQISEISVSMHMPSTNSATYYFHPEPGSIRWQFAVELTLLFLLGGENIIATFLKR